MVTQSFKLLSFHFDMMWTGVKTCFSNSSFLGFFINGLNDKEDDVACCCSVSSLLFFVSPTNQALSSALRGTEKLGMGKLVLSLEVFVLE